MKRLISVLFVITIVLSFTSCSTSSPAGSSSFTKYEKWATETDESGSSHRWEFSSKELTQYIVIDGEDTFSQTFQYKLVGSTLNCTSDFATLTYEITFNGDSEFTAKSETGQTLKFKGK